MNPKEFTDAWGRFTSGEELTDAEIRGMEWLLESDAVLRAEVAEDHQLHRMLKSMGVIHETQDEFVSGVVAACEGVDNPFAPLLSDEAAGDRRKPLKILGIACLTALLSAAVLVTFLYSRLDQAQSEANRAMQLAEEARNQAEHATKLSLEQVRLARQERNEAQSTSAPPTGEDSEEAGNQKSQAIAKTDDKLRVQKQSVNHAVQAESVNEVIAVLSAVDQQRTWKGSVVGGKLGAGEFELLSGEAILRMSGGSVVQVLSPARFTLHHATHLTLHEGDVEVQVASDDIGFRVSTRNTRVVDLGTKFMVSVNEEGRTRVHLDAGEVAVVPAKTSLRDSRFYLREGEMDEAVIVGDGNSEDGLFASYGAGPAGFQGSVRLDGSSFKLTSLERFNHVLQSVSSMYRADPERTKRFWRQAQMMIARLSGTVAFGDDEFLLNSLDNILAVEEQFVRMNDPAAGRARTRSIVGEVTVVGKQHRFRSQKTYEELRARILEPLKALGIRTFMEVQRQQDEATNPFVP